MTATCIKLRRVAVLVAVCGGVAAMDASEAPRSGALGLPLGNHEQALPGAVDLGRRLFMDKRLSSNAQMACATCHQPGQGFTETSRSTARGRDGRAIRRNAPTLLNVGLAQPLMHDGAAPSLEVQILTPLLDNNEMANATFASLEARLSEIPEYAQAFRDVFGSQPVMATIGKALAAYQRSLLSGDSAFDRWRFAGDQSALTEQAKRGFALFSGKAGCSRCHTVGESSALLSDNQMHNTGVGADRPVSGAALAGQRSATVNFAGAGDRGRHEVTGDPADLYKYRTPTLRNVAITAPYMHDGSFASLDDVVRFYNRGGAANPNIDPAIKPLDLTETEIADLVAFLRSLTGSNVEDLAREAEAAAPR